MACSQPTHLFRRFKLHCLLMIAMLDSDIGRRESWLLEAATWFQFSFYLETRAPRVFYHPQHRALSCFFHSSLWCVSLLAHCCLLTFRSSKCLWQTASQFNWHQGDLVACFSLIVVGPDIKTWCRSNKGPRGTCSRYMLAVNLIQHQR